MDQYSYSALNSGHFLHKTLALFSILYERKRQTYCTQHVLTELGVQNTAPDGREKCAIVLLLQYLTSVLLSYYCNISDLFNLQQVKCANAPYPTKSCAHVYYYTPEMLHSTLVLFTLQL